MTKNKIGCKDGQTEQLRRRWRTISGLAFRLYAVTVEPARPQQRGDHLCADVLLVDGDQLWGVMHNVTTSLEELVPYGGTESCL